jgi:hypothetical protein
MTLFTDEWAGAINLNRVRLQLHGLPGLCRKVLRNIELGVPVVVRILSRDNAAQHIHVSLPLGAAAGGARAQARRRRRPTWAPP